MSRRSTLTLLLIIVGIALYFTPSIAQTGGWSEPFEISPPIPTIGPKNGTENVVRKYPSSWFPDIVIGPEGSVHIIWHSGIVRGRESSDIIDLLMYRARVNNTWSDFNEIMAPAVGGYTIRNSIALSRDGNFYLLFRSTTSIKVSSVPWSKAWSAQNWSEPRIISSSAAYYDALAIDSNGTLHAFWTEPPPSDPLKPDTDCTRCSDLFYRSSSDGGEFWLAPVNLSRSPDGENRPQVVIDSDNHIHIVWDKGFDWYVFHGVPESGVYRQSKDGGKTWSDSTFFRLPKDVAQALVPKVDPNATPTPVGQTAPKIFYDAVQQTALAVTADGNPLVVYRGIYNDRVYFQQSLDGGTTWSDPAEIPVIRARNINDNNLDRYSMVVDSNNHVHLLMIGYLPKQNAELNTPVLYHLVWDGTQWSDPVVVMANSDLYPEWPRLAVYEGNHLYASWFTRSKENLFVSDRGGYRVWFSELLLDIPRKASLPTFTPVPTIVVTPTVEQLPTPTASPLPAGIVNAPTILGPPAWEAPALQILLFALGPVVLLIGIVIMIRYLRSR